MPETDDPPDAELMRRVAEGGREAFSTLYRRHQASVYRFARLMMGSATAAADVVQDVFLSVMRDGSRWDASRSSLTSYLYGIARHHTRRRLLRERRFTALDDSDAGVNAVAAGDVSEDLARQRALVRLRAAIVTLPSRYREVIVLCDLHGLNYADAADAIGCAVGTVRSRLHRGRHMLGERMRRAGASRSLVPVRVVRCEA